METYIIMFVDIAILIIVGWAFIELTRDSKIITKIAEEIKRKEESER
jgi:hypothetical protein